MGYSRSIVPSPHRGCQCYVCKSLKFHLLFYHIFLDIQTEKTKKSGFLVPVWIFSGNPCEDKDFCQKKKKTLEVQNCIFSKKYGNLLYGRGGEASFFWNSPMHLKIERELLISRMDLRLLAQKGPCSKIMAKWAYGSKRCYRKAGMHIEKPYKE